MDSSAIRFNEDVPTSNDPVNTTTSIVSKLMKFDQEIRSKEEEVHSKQIEVDHAEQVIEQQIQGKEQQIRSKEEEIRFKEEEIQSKQQNLDRFQQTTTDESNQSLKYRSRCGDELSSLQDDVILLQRELGTLINELRSFYRDLRSLRQEQYSLRQELHSLRQDKFALEQSFREGRYFAALLDHWKCSTVEIESDQKWMRDVQWTDFWRTPEEADSIRIRRYDTRQGNFTTDHPYKATRRGAQIQDTFAVASDAVGATTSRQHSSENLSTPRYEMVWPTDIFGNGFLLSDEDIVNLLPAGQAHNEWMHIAASVVGLGNNSNNNDDDDDEQAAGVWKKALRGYQKGTTKNSRTVAGSGLVNFVSNKLRMANHQQIFDGQFPKAILIPTMSLESAKTWKGEAYSAIFAFGLVETDCDDDDDDVSVYHHAVRLNWTEAIYEGVIRDASAIEIESARITLTHAVIAVRDFMRNSNAASRINDFDIPKTGQDRLYQSHKHANETTYPLPQKVEATENQKPLCLVRFGSCDDKDKHPAPDPLLLAYKAATIWGMVTDKRLLSNGADPYTYSFYDDQGYYEGPKTWEELAMGLGQPHGYQES
ncbi:hypothetical protein IV203_034362 [Nitzschia inconspicua]|uniref:Uncharacterized protein n=1 Tax=Nitzschia inconspicua TaxID=303405 RepID=A0A9K3K716_9STRA|nr:hypothetical protein IV203_022835 [Nitzschia inconspicua]KAG7373638.1 hypothetical protein IV203_034362 [Nitzschia inconspicua]